jgi:hypothetical protein
MAVRGAGRVSGTVVLAHAGVHGGAAAELLRLGPLLALLLVAAWAWLARTGAAEAPRQWLGAGAAVALGVAGVVHLALVGEHAREGLAAGVFFAAAGVVELLLAVAVWRVPGSRRAALGAAVVAGGLLVLYAVSRLADVPALGGQEAVDALGLVTKLLELAGAVLAAAAAGGWSPRPVRPGLVVGATTLAVALAARGLFGLGAEPWTVVAVVAVTVGVGLAAWARDGEDLGVAAADGAVLALLLRADGLAPYLLAGLVAGLLRVAAWRWPRSPLAPVAVAALVVLAVPAFDARMEILHVGHAGDTVAWMVMFLAAAALTLGVWRSGRLPVVAGFFAAHLGLQALRLLAGQTSVEAVEVPAASLGLFLLATVVLADPRYTPGSVVPAVLVGALAGGIDVALRALGMPYAPLLAVAIALAVAAPFGSTPSGGAVDQDAVEAPAVSGSARAAARRSQGRPG